jgi:hypothetical protein
MQAVPVGADVRPSVDIHSTVSKRFGADDRRRHPKVVEQLKRWWDAIGTHINTDGDDNLHYGEYKLFYMRLVYAFNADECDDNDLSPDEVVHALATDWANDSHGDGDVDLPDFLDSIFELSRTHAEDEAGDGVVRANDLATHLADLYLRVFDVDPSTVQKWWDENIGERTEHIKAAEDAVAGQWHGLRKITKAKKVRRYLFYY